MPNALPQRQVIFGKMRLTPSNTRTKSDVLRLLER